MHGEEVTVERRAQPRADEQHLRTGNKHFILKVHMYRYFKCTALQFVCTYNVPDGDEAKELDFEVRLALVVIVCVVVVVLCLERAPPRPATRTYMYSCNRATIRVRPVQF